MNFARTKFFNSSSAVVATILTWERNVVKFVYLDEANKKLQEENASLKKKIASNFISIDSSTVKINDTIRKLSFQEIPATVINSTYNYPNNYFTIDAGTAKGIKKKMGVVSSDGVVGIVYDVSKHFSVVKSILTSNINISAYINNSDAYGIIKYENGNPRSVQLTGISNDIFIKKGSQVKTRGSAGYFPAGTPIGVIESITPIEGKPLWNITVRLKQDMRKLRYVYVIKNLHQLELDTIEEKINELK
ncbi:MAG: rod shape-determining protein MreC [Brumimicrobium sp.]|nr:rod shape-determining protein MreC [Brumimicrobium sp.]MCO5267331.1 rod shape-determining protein MreC [Brumimicrobium sp.]